MIGRPRSIHPIFGILKGSYSYFDGYFPKLMSPLQNVHIVHFFRLLRKEVVADSYNLGFLDLGITNYHVDYWSI